MIQLRNSSTSSIYSRYSTLWKLQLAIGSMNGNRKYEEDMQESNLHGNERYGNLLIPEPRLRPNTNFRNVAERSRRVRTRNQRDWKMSGSCLGLLDSDSDSDFGLGSRSEFPTSWHKKSRDKSSIVFSALLGLLWRGQRKRHEIVEPIATGVSTQYVPVYLCRT
jgi:hypothetical protein